jgi:hypothetical protein
MDQAGRMVVGVMKVTMCRIRHLLAMGAIVRNRFWYLTSLMPWILAITMANATAQVPVGPGAKCSRALL